jgi:hypothetical protein
MNNEEFLINEKYATFNTMCRQFLKFLDLHTYIFINLKIVFIVCHNTVFS